MRRLLLPLLIVIFWLTSVVGGGWLRARCMQECVQMAQVERAQVADQDLPSCCAKRLEKIASAKHDNCMPGNCPKCQAAAKAFVAALHAPDAPLFFDTVCGVVKPVVLASAAPVAIPMRAWRWSLPPPDTLLNLHCQLSL